MYIYIYTYRPAICGSTHIHTNAYGLATMGRLLKTSGLFCKRALLKRLCCAKETYNFEASTHRSHPIKKTCRVYTLHTLYIYIYIYMYIYTYHPANRVSTHIYIL